MRAVITGGTKGIGRATAERIATEDSRIIVNYMHDHAAAQDTVAALEARGAWAMAVRADSCSLEGARELASIAKSELGAVDALVHCAVWVTSSPTLEIDPATYLEAVERNGVSILWLAQAFSEHLSDGAGVVYVTSDGSVKAVPNYVALGTAKALGESLVRYLAVALAPRGIRINSVSAGAVDTEALRAVARRPEALLAAAEKHNPSGRALKPADVAGAISLLLGPDAGMVQGERLHVDGGLSLKG